MNFHDRKAIYLQIVDYFYDNILRKKMLPGDRIPSVRELAQQAEVTPNTVMRAYTHMQERGVIFNKRGIGYFISDDAFEIAKKIKQEEFMKEEAPIFFKQMEALGLNMNDIQKLYNQLKTSENEKNQ